MVTTSVGLFDGFSEVVRAAEILQGCGFSRDELSAVTRTDKTPEVCREIVARRNRADDKRGCSLPADLGTFAADARPLPLKATGWVAAAGPLAHILVNVLDETRSGDPVDLRTRAGATLARTGAETRQELDAL